MVTHKSHEHWPRTNNNGSTVFEEIMTLLIIITLHYENWFECVVSVMILRKLVNCYSQKTNGQPDKK